MDLKAYCRKILFCLIAFITLPTLASVTVFVEPNDGYTPTIKPIKSAESSIDMAVYMLSDKTIINALIDAEKRGVTVRVILEKKLYNGKKQPERVRKRLKAAGIHVKWSNPAYFSLTHEKSFDVDHKTVVIMSLNQTYSGYHFNRDYGAIATNAGDVNEIENTFDGDWQRKYHPVTQENLVWSPNNATCKLVRLIQSAKSNLVMEAEELDDKTIENLLIQKAQNGVDVRVVMPPQTNTASQQHIVHGGVHLRILNNKTNQLYMHAKMMISDGHKAYIGSENPSSYSLQMNRELGILLKDSNNIHRLELAFRTDWSNSRPFH